MSDPTRRRFKFNPSQIGNMPARPPVTRAAAPEAKDIKRRQIMTVQPSGKIIWHDWTTHEKARTNLAIQKAVATENLWKRK